MLCPVNDNADLEGAGGTHWSLLAYHRARNVLAHYDSLPGANAEAARRVGPAMRVLVGAPAGCKFSEARASRQDNAFDCGAHCLVAMRALAQGLADGADSGALSAHGGQASATELRAELRRIASALVADPGRYDA